MGSAVAVTLRQLRAFQAVTDLGSFTRAAERMRVAQPALSQLVRELEAELGLRLFDRTTRRVELTEPGRLFHEATVKILQDLDIAVRDAHDLAERRGGRIVVATPPLLASVILPDAIRAMRERHPGIRVAILDARTDSIVEAVRLGRADCAIGTFAPGEEGIDRVGLARDSLMVFAPAGHPVAAVSGPLGWRDLAGLGLVTLTRDSGIRILVELGFESAEVPFQPAYEVSQITTALSLVEAGLGVAVLPTYARAVADGRPIAVRPLVGPVITRDIVLIRRADRAVSPAVAAFEAVVRASIRRRAPAEAI